MIVPAAEPAFVVAHTVVHHLRMNLQQVEVNQWRVILATADLGFHAVALASPVEVIGPFAEQRSAVCVPHEPEQLDVVLHLGQRHGGHRLAGLVIQLVPALYQAGDGVPSAFNTRAEGSYDGASGYRSM